MQKASLESEVTVNISQKHIAKELKLEDRLDTTSKRQTLVTQKVHKPNFQSSPTCKQVNATNSKWENQQTNPRKSKKRSKQRQTQPMGESRRSFQRFDSKQFPDGAWGAFIYSGLCDFTPPSLKNSHWKQ